MSDNIDSSLAMVFPGQGSQSLGMLSDLSEEYPEVQQTFAEASKILGYDLWKLAQSGPEKKLNQTQYTQPLLLAADIAVWRCWQTLEGSTPALLAGHSLGEYSALVCAGAMTFHDAVEIVAKRGLYMQEAVPDGVGAMAAIIGLDNHEIIAVCAEAAQADEIVSTANFNSIGQTVIAGHKAAVERAMVLAKKRNAAMTKILPVSVPSHCALMDNAAQRLGKELEKININSPSIPILHNSDVASHADPQEIRNILVEQLTTPVRWVGTIQKMAENGIKVVIECGPGKILTGLNKRVTSTVVTYPIGMPEQLVNAVDAVRGVALCH